jgi:hypothetical protein
MLSLIDIFAILVAGAVFVFLHGDFIFSNALLINSHWSFGITRRLRLGGE